MNLEKLLSEQGTDTLNDSVNGAPLRAFINAKLKRLGVEAITKETPCDLILETIYGIDDTTIQEQLLNREVSEIKGNLNINRVFSYSAILLTVGVLIFFTMAVKGETPLTPEEIDLIKSIGSGALNVLASLLNIE